MTERLTIDGLCASEECDGYCQTCDYMGKILEKLAHYEDLEEQGRLVVLSDELFIKLFASGCPYEYGLKEVVDCPLPNKEMCKECWETALKGE